MAKLRNIATAAHSESVVPIAAERAQFRPDIQGLRAIAVVLVVVYHLWPNQLPGGYIGVDIFFVISGLLITTHLLSEVERTGTVSVTRFWARRVRRLLPAASLVLFAALVAAFVWIPDALVQRTLKEIAASAVYLENWLLASDSVDYLAADQLPSLVQHYWSLSVEEQFYLAWPLLIVAGVAATRFAPGLLRRSVSPNRVTVAYILGAIFIGSLAYSIILTAVSQPAAYFNTGVRAWEFAAGGLVACLLSARADKPLVPARWMSSVAWLGLIGIAVSAFVITDSSPFPGSIALLPVAATILVIVAGAHRGRLAPHAVLAWRPVQKVGDWSYSIYLWHWPMIALFPFVFGTQRSAVGSVGILVLTIALGAVTKHFVEDPIRTNRTFGARRWPAFSLAAAAAAVLVVVCVVQVRAIDTQKAEAATWAQEQLVSEADCFGAAAMHNDCAEPFTLTARTDLAFAATDLDPDWCIAKADEEWRSCEYGDTTNPSSTIALVGDSHGAALVPAFDTYFADRNVRVVTYLRVGCPALSSTPIDMMNRPVWEQEACAVWSERVTSELVARDDIDDVVYSQFSSRYTDPDVPEAGRLTAATVAETWQRVAASGKTVALLRDIPNINRVNIPSCLSTAVVKTGPCSFERAPALLKDQVTEAALVARVPTVDLSDDYCDETRCYAVIGDVVVYADDNHVSGTYAKSLAPYLGPAIERALSG